MRRFVDHGKKVQEIFAKIANPQPRDFIDAGVNPFYAWAHKIDRAELIKGWGLKDYLQRKWIVEKPENFLDDLLQGRIEPDEELVLSFCFYMGLKPYQLSSFLRAEPVMPGIVEAAITFEVAAAYRMDTNDNQQIFLLRQEEYARFLSGDGFNRPNENSKFLLESAGHSIAATDDDFRAEMSSPIHRMIDMLEEQVSRYERHLDHEAHIAQARLKNINNEYARAEKIAADCATVLAKNDDPLRLIQIYRELLAADDIDNVAKSIMAKPFKFLPIRNSNEMSLKLPDGEFITGRDNVVAELCLNMSLWERARLAHAPAQQTARQALEKSNDFTRWFRSDVARRYIHAEASRRHIRAYFESRNMHIWTLPGAKPPRPAAEGL